MIGVEEGSKDPGQLLQLVSEEVEKRFGNWDEKELGYTRSIQLTPPGEEGGDEWLIIQFYKPPKVLSHHQSPTNEVFVTSCSRNKSIGEVLRVFSLRIPGPTEARQMSPRDLEMKIKGTALTLLIRSQNKEQSQLKNLVDAIKKWDSQSITFEQAGKLSGIAIG